MWHYLPSKPFGHLTQTVLLRFWLSSNFTEVLVKLVHCKCNSMGRRHADCRQSSKNYDPNFSFDLPNWQFYFYNTKYNFFISLYSSLRFLLRICLQPSIWFLEYFRYRTRHIKNLAIGIFLSRMGDKIKEWDICSYLLRNNLHIR